MRSASRLSIAGAILLLSQLALAACGPASESTRHSGVSSHSASFAVRYASELRHAPKDFQALRELLSAGGVNTVVRHDTWDAWVASDADVLILRGFIGISDTQPVAPLADRRVIGIGDGACDVFHALGLEISDGASSVSETPRVALGTSSLISEASRGKQFLALREPLPLGEPEFLGCDGLYLPEGSELLNHVEVLARWSHDWAYAPIARQGNKIYCGFKPNLKVWTPELKRLFLDIAVRLSQRPQARLALIQREVTGPGTYPVRLPTAVAGERSPETTFYFKFPEPVLFAVRLDVRQGAVSTHLTGQITDRVFERVESTGQGAVSLASVISSRVIEDNRGHYWRLTVASTAIDARLEATLTIGYAEDRVLTFPNGLESSIASPAQKPAQIASLVRYLMSKDKELAAQAALALQLAGEHARTALRGAMAEAAKADDETRWNALFDVVYRIEQDLGI